MTDERAKALSWQNILGGSTRDCPTCGETTIESAWIEGTSGIGHFHYLWCESCRTGVVGAGFETIPAGEHFTPPDQVLRFRVVGLFDVDRSWLRKREANERSLIHVVQWHPDLRLHPGLSEAELHQFQQTLPGPLPPNVADLLRFASGFDVPGGEPVDFTGRSHSFQLDDAALSHPLALSKTETGDFWIVEVQGDGTWGPVSFACHDPMMVRGYCESLDGFIRLAARPERIRAEADSLTRSR